MRQVFKNSCCTTPSALCLWGVAFLTFYGFAQLLRNAWPPLEPYGDTLVLAAMAGACLVNFRRNRTLHCALTAPLFIVASAVTALVEARIWHVDMPLVWSVIVAAVALAFVIEWRVAPRHKTT